MDDRLYAPAFADNNPTGFTNNFLESRRPIHYFDQKYDDYKLYEDTNRPNTIYRDLLKSRVERSVLSDGFFGDSNIEQLKKLICNQVYQKSGGLYKIDAEAQNTESLITVMMPIYLEHAKHHQYDIARQIGELNILVLDIMLPSVISNIKHSLSFIRDHSQQHLTLDRPVNVSSAGTKSNDMTRRFI